MGPTQEILMKMLLLQLERYQAELTHLSRTVTRGWDSLKRQPGDTTERQEGQQARLILAALREHQQAANALYDNLERLVSTLTIQE
jgi:hypothetical protein